MKEKKMLNIELETVEISAATRTAGNGEYDTTVAALVAKGWEIGKGMKKGVTPAQHAGLRGAIARHNERVGADSPDRLNVSFHVVAKGADGKPAEYSFRRNANDAVRRGRKPAAVAVAAPAVETLEIPAS
jgi:hypothetical protein